MENEMFKQGEGFWLTWWEQLNWLSSLFFPRMKIVLLSFFSVYLIRPAFRSHGNLVHDISKVSIVYTDSNKKKGRVSEFWGLHFISFTQNRVKDNRELICLTITDVSAAILNHVRESWYDNNKIKYVTKYTIN